MVTAIRNIQTSPDITNANAKEVRTIAAPRKPTNIYKARTRQGDRKREYANVSDITNADAKAPTKPTKAHPYDRSGDKLGYCQAHHDIQTRQVDQKQEHTTRKNSRRAIARLQRHQHNKRKCPDRRGGHRDNSGSSIGDQGSRTDGGTSNHLVKSRTSQGDLKQGYPNVTGHSKRRRQKGIRTHSGTGENRSKYRIAQRMHGGTE